MMTKIRYAGHALNRDWNLKKIFSTFTLLGLTLYFLAFPEHPLHAAGLWTGAVGLMLVVFIRHYSVPACRLCGGRVCGCENSPYYHPVISPLPMYRDSKNSYADVLSDREACEALERLLRFHEAFPNTTREDFMFLVGRFPNIAERVVEVKKERVLRAIHEEDVPNLLRSSSQGLRLTGIRGLSPMEFSAFSGVRARKPPFSKLYC